jgi:integrase/recombinase XerD
MTTMRWMEEVRRLKPSTVSRRLSVLSCFYTTCVIDGILDHSPAEYVGDHMCHPNHRRWA